MSTTEALHACECETTLQGWCAAQGRVVQSLAQGGMYHLVLGAGLGGRSARVPVLLGQHITAYCQESQYTRLHNPGTVLHIEPLEWLLIDDLSSKQTLTSAHDKSECKNTIFASGNAYLEHNTTL